MNFGGVGLFFIMSEALLWHNYKKDFKLKLFYEKRIQRIFLPQWIGFIVAFIIVYVMNSEIVKSNPSGILISFMGLNYCNKPWDSLGINTYG